MTGLMSLPRWRKRGRFGAGPVMPSPVYSVQVCVLGHWHTIRADLPRSAAHGLARHYAVRGYHARVRKQVHHGS